MKTIPPDELFSVYKTRGSLLARLKDDRNEPAWKEFCDIYGRLIFGYSLHFNITHAEAEDIVQEVCIKVFRQISRFDYAPEKGRFRGWLKTMTRNTVVDYLRRKQCRKNVSSTYQDYVEHEIAAEQITDDERWRMEWEKTLYETALKRVRERVGEESFSVFKLYVLGDEDIQEVVRQSGLNANAVYAVKHRIMRYIREEIDVILAGEDDGR